MIDWNNTKDYPLGKKDGDEFVLFVNYEDVRLFSVKTNSGFESIVGYIGGDGSLYSESGDDSGYTWEDVTHWSDFNDPSEGELIFDQFQTLTMNEAIDAMNRAGVDECVCDGMVNKVLVEMGFKLIPFPNKYFK